MLRTVVTKLIVAFCIFMNARKVDTEAGSPME